MIKFFKILFLSLILIGCTKEVTHDKVEYGNNGIYLKETGELYTGKIIEKDESYSFVWTVKNGQYDGESMIFENGKIISKDNYKNGELNGKSVSYHSNGKLSKKCNYKNGELDGEWLEYYENGNLKEELMYKEGIPIGNYIVYHKNGNVAIKCNYDNGKLNGEYVKYYENNKIAVKCSYKNGELDGEYISYYEDGSIKIKSNLKNGNFIDYISYYKNGNKKILFSEQEYIEGFKGFISYYENGNIETEERYDRNGEILKAIFIMWENGNSKEHHFYYNTKEKFEELKANQLKNNKSMENSYFYEIDNPDKYIEEKLKREMKLKHELVQKERKIFYNEKGYPIKSIEYFTEKDENFDNNGNTLKYQIEYFYENENIVKIKETIPYELSNGIKDCGIREINIIDGKREGKIIEKGRTFTHEYSFINDVLQGEGKTYFHLNKTTIKYVNKDGKRNGKATAYYADGAREEFNYKDGIVEGEAKYYWKNGNFQEMSYKNGKLNGKAIFHLTYYGRISSHEVFYYEDGVKQGKVIWYSKDWEKIKEGNYKDGKLDGEFFEYDNYYKKVKVYNVVQGVKYFIEERSYK